MKKGDRWKLRLGLCIREFRMRRGWTQHELAARLKRYGFVRCSRSLLSQIESGLATLRAYEVYYLRQVFGEAFEREFWQPFGQKAEEPESKEAGR